MKTSPLGVHPEDAIELKAFRSELEKKFGRPVTITEALRIAVRAVSVEVDRVIDAGLSGPPISV